MAPKKKQGGVTLSLHAFQGATGGKTNELDLPTHSGDAKERPGFGSGGGGGDGQWRGDRGAGDFGARRDGPSRDGGGFGSRDTGEEDTNWRSSMAAPADPTRRSSAATGNVPEGDWSRRPRPATDGGADSDVTWQRGGGMGAPAADSGFSRGSAAGPDSAGTWARGGGAGVGGGNDLRGGRTTFSEDVDFGDVRSAPRQTGSSGFGATGPSSASAAASAGGLSATAASRDGRFGRTWGSGGDAPGEEAAWRVAGSSRQSAMPEYLQKRAKAKALGSSAATATTSASTAAVSPPPSSLEAPRGDSSRRSSAAVSDSGADAPSAPAKSGSPAGAAPAATPAAGVSGSPTAAASAPLPTTTDPSTPVALSEQVPSPAGPATVEVCRPSGPSKADGEAGVLAPIKLRALNKSAVSKVDSSVSVTAVDPTKGRYVPPSRRTAMDQVKTSTLSPALIKPTPAAVSLTAQEAPATGGVSPVASPSAGTTDRQKPVELDTKAAYKKRQLELRQQKKEEEERRKAEKLEEEKKESEARQKLMSGELSEARKLESAFKKGLEGDGDLTLLIEGAEDSLKALSAVHSLLPFIILAKVLVIRSFEAVEPLCQKDSEEELTDDAREKGVKEDRAKLSAVASVVRKAKTALQRLIQSSGSSTFKLKFLLEIQRIVNVMGFPRLSPGLSFIESIWDALYMEDAIEEQHFKCWYDATDDATPGRAKVLFEMNCWLDWLNGAMRAEEGGNEVEGGFDEDEDDEDED